MSDSEEDRRLTEELMRNIEIVKEMTREVGEQLNKAYPPKMEVKCTKCKARLFPEYTEAKEKVFFRCKKCNALTNHPSTRETYKTRDDFLELMKNFICIYDEEYRSFEVGGALKFPECLNNGMFYKMMEFFQPFATRERNANSEKWLSHYKPTWKKLKMILEVWSDPEWKEGRYEFREMTGGFDLISFLDKILEKIKGFSEQYGYRTPKYRAKKIKTE